MTHYMSLNSQPFDMIACELKTIELRLCDEKRRNIKVDDIIVFSKNTNQDEQLTVKVVNLYKFSTFDELYQSIPLDKCGYLPEQLSTARSKDMEVYYSIEKQKQYGVLGIEVKLINE